MREQEGRVDVISLCSDASHITFTELPRSATDNVSLSFNVHTVCLSVFVKRRISYTFPTPRRTRIHLAKSPTMSNGSHKLACNYALVWRLW